MRSAHRQKSGEGAGLPCEHGCVVQAKSAGDKSAAQLMALSRLINQAVGDAISGILLVECVLRHKPLFLADAFPLSQPGSRPPPSSPSLCMSPSPLTLSPWPSLNGPFNPTGERAGHLTAGRSSTQTLHQGSSRFAWRTGQSSRRAPMREPVSPPTRCSLPSKLRLPVSEEAGHSYGHQGRRMS